MATTETSYRVLSLPQEALEGDGDRVFIGLRRTLDIGAFGAGAVYQAKTGEGVIGEHDELGPGSDRQEELYVVVQGSAAFTVDGEEIDAPHGTVVFVRPEAKRQAVATSDETIVLAVGGRRGEAYRVPPGGELFDFFEHYNKQDYEAALAACRAALEKFPGNALVLYNIACMQSMLGRGEEALETLHAAVEGWPQFKENAQQDDDFTSLREDPKFLELVG
ncbi:MAG TPA: tetratricopeptide repeat protein [Gaiellaceae bacterium]|nr:tetratricopeptide repeat protein [Gaiellaceae bacterium]